MYACMCVYMYVSGKRKSFQTIAKLQMKMLRASAMETHTLTHIHTYIHMYIDYIWIHVVCLPCCFTDTSPLYTGKSLLTVIVVDLTIVDTPCFAALWQC